MSVLSVNGRHAAGPGSDAIRSTGAVPLRRRRQRMGLIVYQNVVIDRPPQLWESGVLSIIPFIVPVGPGSDWAISAAEIGRSTARVISTVSPSTVPLRARRFTIFRSATEPAAVPAELLLRRIAGDFPIQSTERERPLRGGFHSQRRFSDDGTCSGRDVVAVGADGRWSSHVFSCW